MSDLRGHVYQLKISDRYDGLPHPYVVVLEIDGSRECLVVPAFTTGGYAVTDRWNAFRRLGFRDDQIAVRIDNAANMYVANPAFTPHLADWFVADVRRLTRSDVINGTHLGILHEQAFVAVVRGVVANAAGGGTIISPSLLKKLAKLCA